MKKLILVLIVSFLNAQDLKELLNLVKNNDLFKAKELLVKSERFELNSINAKYLPTLDLGLNYEKISPKPKLSYYENKAFYAKISYKLYDGGYKNYLKKSKQNQLKASYYDKKSLQTLLQEQVVKLFYNYFKLIENTKALTVQKKELLAQLKRVKKYFNAKLMDEVEIYKIKAAIEANKYNLENLKYLQKSTLKNLELLTNSKIKNLKYAKFKLTKNLQFTPNYNYKNIMANSNAILQNANAIKSNLMPQVTLTNSYSKFKSSFVMPTNIPNYQNSLKLNINLHIDGGEIKNSAQALKMQALALKLQAKNNLKKQKTDFYLAKENLKTSQKKYLSAKKALIAAKKVYIKTKKEYKSGLVDFVTYISALSSFVKSKADLKNALIDIQEAKANVIFKSGNKIWGYIK